MRLVNVTDILTEILKGMQIISSDFNITTCQHNSIESLLWPATSGFACLIEASVAMNNKSHWKTSSPM